VCSGEIVPLEIEIWPSATLFEAGTSLQVTIQGHDAARYPAFRHEAEVVLTAVAVCKERRAEAQS